MSLNSESRVARNGNLPGHLAALTAYIIFGLNIIVCKDLVNSHVFTPMGLFTIRATGAALLFWVLSLFTKKEKVPWKDLIQIFIASGLGLYLTQSLFLRSLSMITPLDCSIITTISPIFTMFIAAIVLKEPITLKKAAGVALSFVGVLILILTGVRATSGVTETQPMGVFLIILNVLSFALYLGIFRPLVQRYSVVTFMKWGFLFSVLLSFPFNIGDIVSADFSRITGTMYWELFYIVVFSTFIAYFLVPIGQQRLRPTIVSMYAYVQPIIATVISIYIGMDHLTVGKVLAAVAVVGGVMLVNKSKSRSQA